MWAAIRRVGSAVLGGTSGRRSRLLLASLAALATWIIYTYYEAVARLWNGTNRLTETASTTDTSADCVESTPSMIASVPPPMKAVASNNHRHLKYGQRSRLLIRIRHEYHLMLTHFVPVLEARIRTHFNYQDILVKIRSVRQKLSAIQSNLAASSSKISTASGSPQRSLVDISSEMEDSVAEETALWNELKILIFGSFVTTTYAYSALCVLLRVHLHTLGRAVLLGEGSTGRATVGAGGNVWQKLGLLGAEVSSLEMSSVTSVDGEGCSQLLAQLYEPFLGQGLEDLAKRVREECAIQLADLDVQSIATFRYSDFVESMTNVVNGVNAIGPLEHTRRVIPTGNAVSTTPSPSLPPALNLILEQLWDITESSAFTYVLNEVTEQCVLAMKRRVLKKIFTVTASPAVGNAYEDPVLIEVPLVKVLLSLRDICSSLLSRSEQSIESNEVLALVTKSPFLDSLCLSVFDATDSI